jgi:hypothetical protein
MANVEPPSVLSEDELIAAAAEARETKKTAELTAAPELARRGWSWRRIGKAPRPRPLDRVRVGSGRGPARFRRRGASETPGKGGNE